MTPKSASAANEQQPIIRPADLKLPPELERLMTFLSEPERNNFAIELIQALEMSHTKDNLRPVQDTIEAWWRTVVIREDPAYERNIIDASRNRPRRSYSVEELRDRFAASRGGGS